MCGSSKSNNFSFDQNHLIKNLIFLQIAITGTTTTIITKTSDKITTPTSTITATANQL